MAYQDYKKYRVRTPVKSFRDLEVYQTATNLSAEIFNLKIPSKYNRNKDVIEEVNKLRSISREIPRLIVESYSDKFTNLALADQKLEKAAMIVNMAIAKIDFLNAVIEDKTLNQDLTAMLNKYQRGKMKIINLKRAWNRVFGGK